jgi:hypothetical protein
MRKLQFEKKISFKFFSVFAHQNPGSGTAFGSALNQCGSETLERTLVPRSQACPNKLFYMVERRIDENRLLGQKVSSMYHQKKHDGDLLLIVGIHTVLHTVFTVPVFRVNKKIAIYLLPGLLNRRPRFRRSLRPQKRTSSTSKHEITSMFSILFDHFCSPGSGSAFPFADPDPAVQAL